MKASTLLLILWSSVIAQPLWAGGTFSTLTYNIAGLLEPFSSSRPATNTKIISCKIRGYSIVNVQEDFNYHADLYDSCDDHPYRSPTSGGMGIGSGLNSLSYFPFEDFSRSRWSDCNGVDCLTPKGWTSMRVQLQDGVYLSVYNLHSQAQTEPKDLEARRKNMLQMLNAIETESGSDAILVMGDTNTRYTREGDNIEEFLKRGFRDVWIDLVRNGQVPQRGEPALTNCAPRTSSNCEVVDKVLYRSSRSLQLQPLSYLVDDSFFVDAAGAPLSDHYPIAVEWRYETQSGFLLSSTWGGPHGQAFNDLGVLGTEARITTLTLRSGERLDRIEARYSDGSILSHGGSGGSARSMTLEPEDDWIMAEICSTSVKGRTRIGFVAFTSRFGRKLEGGQRTASCVLKEARDGYRISGFHGRSGDEIDRLGLIFTPALP